MKTFLLSGVLFLMGSSGWGQDCGRTFTKVFDNPTRIEGVQLSWKDDELGASQIKYFNGDSIVTECTSNEDLDCEFEDYSSRSDRGLLVTKIEASALRVVDSAGDELSTGTEQICGMLPWIVEEAPQEPSNEEDEGDEDEGLDSVTTPTPADNGEESLLPAITELPLSMPPTDLGNTDTSVSTTESVDATSEAESTSGTQSGFNDPEVIDESTPEPVEPVVEPVIDEATPEPVEAPLRKGWKKVGRVIGLVENISRKKGLVGWACQVGVANSLDLEVYAKAPRSSRILIGTFRADKRNGKPIRNICGALGAHRFRVPASALVGHEGKQIIVAAKPFRSQINVIRKVRGRRVRGSIMLGERKFLRSYKGRIYRIPPTCSVSLVSANPVLLAENKIPQGGSRLQFEITKSPFSKLKKGSLRRVARANNRFREINTRYAFIVADKRNAFACHITYAQEAKVCPEGSVVRGNRCVRQLCQPGEVGNPLVRKIKNGTRSQNRTCNATGTRWGAPFSAPVITCEQGAILVGNRCVRQECTPNERQEEVVPEFANGTKSRSRVCNGAGTAHSRWSAFAITCNTGFVKKNNKCVAPAPRRPARR